jgi:hypothetical protein
MILNWNLCSNQFYKNTEKIINKIRLYNPEIIVLQKFNDSIIKNYITNDYNFHNYKNELLIGTKHKIISTSNSNNIIFTLIDHPYYGKINIANTHLFQNKNNNNNNKYSCVNRINQLNYILNNYNVHFLCGTLYEDFENIKTISNKYKLNEKKIITNPYNRKQEDYILANIPSNNKKIIINSDITTLSPHRLLTLYFSK